MNKAVAAESGSMAAAVTREHDGVEGTNAIRAAVTVNLLPTDDCLTGMSDAVQTRIFRC